MRAEGIQFDKFVVSFVVSSCLENYNNPRSSIYLKRYLKLASVYGLQTNALCQQVLSALTALDDEASVLACQLHIFYLPQYSCKTATLTALFSKLQSYAENSTHLAFGEAHAVGYLAKALLELYALNKVGDQVIAVPNDRFRLLRIQHFNRYAIIVCSVCVHHFLLVFFGS